MKLEKKKMLSLVAAPRPHLGRSAFPLGKCSFPMTGYLHIKSGQPSKVTSSAYSPLACHAATASSRIHKLLITN